MLQLDMFADRTSAATMRANQLRLWFASFAYVLLVVKVVNPYVLDVEEGKRIAHALGESKAAILRNHGILTVGHTVDEAAWLYITMERTCEVQLAAEAAGTGWLWLDPVVAIRG